MVKSSKNRKRFRWIIPLSLLVLLAVSFFAYVSVYYHADETALSALRSDATVSVERTSYGYLFDGPDDTSALIFYPGAKVEETAYAPLLRELAAGGMDVCLVKMPFRLAFFDSGAANRVMREHAYSKWYIGGHSLGGAMAADYAAGHGDELTGVILLAAYASKPLPEALTEVVLIGSEDHVINRARLEQGRNYAPSQYREYIIEGGNHAQFGSYGAQRGDGIAALSQEEQVLETVRFIHESLR